MDSIHHSFFTVKYLEVLPKTHPCPDCGQLAKRNSKGERTLQEPSLDRPTFLIVRMSVCECKNPDCPRKFFRIPLPFAVPRSRYTDQARGLCVSSIVRDGMPFSRVPDRVGEDFHLYPFKSTVWEWHRQETESIDLSVAYQPWVKAVFSGVLGIDEVYDGPFCLILSTDPLNDVIVAYTLEKKSEGKSRPGMNQEWLDRHIEKLKQMGIVPDQVLRDGAPIYDKGLPADWDQSRCNFHIIQDITKDVLKAVNAYRNTLPDPPKRPKGRPKADAPPPPPNVKTQIWHHRYLFVSRPETIKEKDQVCKREAHQCFEKSEMDILQDLCAEHPPLNTARECLLDIWGLFDDKDAYYETVKIRYDALCEQPAYRDNPHLWDALQKLSGDTLWKACRFLEYENLPKTNNHAEHEARSFRKRQKGHYKLRRSSTIDRAMKAEMMRQKARKEARGDSIVRLKRKGDAHHQTQLPKVA